MKFLFQQRIQADWWSKSLAGWVLGLSLAIAIASLITILALKHLAPSLAPQIGMWSVPWLYLPLVFIAYFIPKGWQALLIYTVFNAVAYGILFGIRG
ncbi:hypothetical protein [Acinetobacter sp. ASP199]|uniref:hypothetical protein n=1 Tax=unclassified Acinetobacter TaxID=196816 RepID=UPI001F6256A3|nr:hypothetical protein [Acinetobacter sp. ASP199]UNT58104.1 hypothetical protein IHE35_08100 [Acinetobacter sp. ASP199]